MQPLSLRAPRRDPAPTRLHYRMNRLWLTPLFRVFMRVGLPMVATFSAAVMFWSDADRREAVLLQASDLRRAVEERPEFMVKLMTIEGASTEVNEDIREVLPIDFPITSFDLNLEDMRHTITGLDAVHRAELRIRPGGILEISITERVPAIVWRGRNGLELLDTDGHRVAPLAHRAERADLPLIAGDGAEAQVPEALQLLAAAHPLTPRLRGLVRMGERRWDVVLDREQRIMLPEQGAVAALQRVIALNQADDMLERDLAAIDMRNPARPTLRLAPGAVAEMRRIKLIEAGAGNQ